MTCSGSLVRAKAAAYIAWRYEDNKTASLSK
jgi:hypothetical protein